MWSNRAMRGAAALALAVVLPLLAACGDSRGGGNGGGGGNGNGNGNGNGPLQVDGDGTSQLGGSQLTDALDAMPVTELSGDEAAGLAWMREEEKLAHDVYVTLGEQFDLSIFDNISSAEATHTAAVLALLERHGLADPADGLDIGVFADPTLQGVYDDLLAKGAVSLEAALQVGAEIEELDIVDLRARATETADIALVYGNLEKGSRNHLRAFTRQLDRLGATYEPVHLDADSYDAIVAGDMERGPAG